LHNFIKTLIISRFVKNIALGYIISSSLFVYLTLCFLLYHLGSGKKIGGRRLGLISLLATPITGFIVYYLSQEKMIVFQERYVCQQCKYEFTQPAEFCPICSTAGHKVPLIPEKRNMV
jgi:hypothetical protein